MCTTLILNYFNPNPHVVAYFFAFAAHLSLLGVGIIQSGTFAAGLGCLWICSFTLPIMWRDMIGSSIRGGMSPEILWGNRCGRVEEKIGSETFLGCNTTFEIQIGMKIFKKISFRSGWYGMTNKTTSFISMLISCCMWWRTICLWLSIWWTWTWFLC